MVDRRVCLHLNICLLAALAGLLGLVAGCETDNAAVGETSFEVDEVFKDDTLEVRVLLGKKTISIADVVWLRLEATVNEGTEIGFPKVVDILKDKDQFGVLEYRPISDKLVGDGQVLKGWEYRLEPLVVENCVIPELTFTYSLPDAADKVKLLTKEIAIDVTELPDDAGANVIDDIKDVVELPGGGLGWWLWLIVAGVVGSVVVIVLFARRRNQKQISVSRPAHEIAYERLRQLMEKDLIAAGRIKEFYEYLSHILRSYIENRFQLRAPERTTEEFLQEAESSNVLRLDHQEKLGSFLRHCDLVKFARYGPEKTEIQESIDLAKEFIDATKKE